MRAIALALLLASAGYGQPFVGMEIASAPFQSHALSLRLPPQPAAIISSGRGFVIAWTADNSAGLSRVNVGRLDATAHAVPETLRELPTTQNDAEAGFVSLTAYATGYEVAWIETRAGVAPNAVVATLNEDLILIAGPAVIRESNGPVAVRAFGGSLVVIAGAFLLRLDLDLKPVESMPIGTVADDVAASEFTTVPQTLRRWS